MSTAKRRKQFPVYETLLRLYPKSFRSEYGDQMVQTLADMLNDTHDKRERAAIWLRVAGELPLSVMHEVGSNLGGATMNRLTKISNKQLLFGGVILVALLVVGVFTIGRRPVMQGAGDLLYGRQARNMLVKQNAALGSPFTVPDPKQSHLGTCVMAGVSGLTTRLSCSAGTSRDVTLDETEAGKQSAIQEAKALDAALQKAGYKTSSNGVSVISLVESVYAGKDSSPDAFYITSIGPYACMYGMHVAYAEPLPKAVGSSLTCIRVAYMMGGPFGDRPSTAQDLPL
ncbi:hypothetical protein EYC59_05050 [Candidatus Saccharibacteria bacterium]|nr:MAG: hypothetical protein EYC59_05050 [Candidatus Saccharibacteria bacterium]